MTCCFPFVPFRTVGARCTTVVAADLVAMCPAVSIWVCPIAIGWQLLEVCQLFFETGDFLSELGDGGLLVCGDLSQCSVSLC